MSGKLRQSAPPGYQAVKLLTAVSMGTTLLFLSGLALTGTVMALIIATPLLVLFSPVLVPAGIALFLVATGFVFSGGCGVAAVAALSGLYKYIANYAAAKRRASVYGQFVQIGL